MRTYVRCSTGLAALVLIASFTLGANASVAPVSSSFFSGTPVTFNGLADGTEVNGLTTDGILFNYLIGGTPTNGQVQIDGGPGTTNHVAPPNVVSVGNNSGTLKLTLPGFDTAVGYGFAVDTSAALSSATTVTLFNGTTNVGSLSFAGSPDPSFSGGFAGISSTVPFNIVDLTFNSSSAPAFAADNFVFASAAPVPEPESFGLVASGIVGLLALKRRILA